MRRKKANSQAYYTSGIGRSHNHGYGSGSHYGDGFNDAIGDGSGYGYYTGLNGWGDGGGPLISSGCGNIFMGGSGRGIANASSVGDSL